MTSVQSMEQIKLGQFHAKPHLPAIEACPGAESMWLWRKLGQSLDRDFYRRTEAERKQARNKERQAGQPSAGRRSA